MGLDHGPNFVPHAPKLDTITRQKHEMVFRGWSHAHALHPRSKGRFPIVSPSPMRAHVHLHAWTVVEAIRMLSAINN